MDATKPVCIVLVKLEPSRDSTGLFVSSFESHCIFSGLDICKRCVDPIFFLLHSLH